MDRDGHARNERDTTRTLLTVAAVAVLALFAVPAVGMLIMLGVLGTMRGVGPFGVWMPMFGAGGGMMLLFALVPVALLALLVWAVRGQRSSPARGDALAILQRRYAAGEIQREEYERIRTDLLRDRG